MEAKQKEIPLPVSIGLLILRLGIGGYLMTHGWGKVQMLLAGGAEKFGDPIGLGSTLSLALATGAEFLCALLILLGLATRLAAVPVVITMAVAAFVIHAGDPWTMEAAANAFFSGASKTWFAKEPALLYLIPFLSLVFTGGGKLSIDGLIAMRRNPHRVAERRGFERTEERRAA
jgi:putative oxidoreductase